MKIRTVLAMAFLLCVTNASFAQFVTSGKVASANSSEGTINIIVKSVSAEGPPAPTEFKVLDKAAFVSVRPGDLVTFTSKNVNGVLTISRIAKQ